MRKTLILATFLTLHFALCTLQLNAQQRRPVDNRHPLWLVHIDVWNHADPQKIIDLIPADIKPYVCMNLSLSCSYDTALAVHVRPQNAVRTYKSWASVCQKNGLWFTCQPASGGHTHILDDDLETFEYFYKAYPNFLGWNFAEQFWGFDEPGDKYSSSQVDRIALFAKLVPMAHKYGGFLTISFCGNIWSHGLNPVGMMKRNAELLQACKDYPDAIVWLYKYTTSSCFYNNESTTFGPFVAGLTRNYGVRYDNCGYNGALEALLGEDNGKKYPIAAGIGTIMEQTCQNGGAIWDGPELIWTEDFQNLANTTSTSGYTIRNWGRFPGFDNAWIDMFRKIIDGTMYIPSQQEVIDKTKVLIVNNVTEGSDENKYATWGDLYDGLYKQTDPFNPNGGQWMNNYCYFKSTGRYGTIPMTPSLTDMSKTIPNRIGKKQVMAGSSWATQAAKVQMFNDAYPEVSNGDLFVSRYKNQLVTYTPYTYLNSKTMATANIPLMYNTCKSLDLTWGKLSSALVKEYADSITFYMNNYRTDTTAMVKDVIVVNGVTAEPTYTYKVRISTDNTPLPSCMTPVASWDAATGIYTLTVQHNGPVDLTIYCQGAETKRATDYVDNTPLEIPKQPDSFNGTIIIEAEDLPFKDVTASVNDAYYSAYRSVRGHSGNGFVVMGTKTTGSLLKGVKISNAGSYKAIIRYNNTDKDGTIKFGLNNRVQQNLKVYKTAENEWRKDTISTTVVSGSNTLYITNAAGINMILDQIIIEPATQESEKFAVTIREASNGTLAADCTEAAEGTLVTLTASPDGGYVLEGFNVIHGKVIPTLNADGTYSFSMPDDNVTIQPIFRDTTVVYTLNLDAALAGTIPQGWRALESSTSIHEYPNTYTSGARVMSGFTGMFSKALYWRTMSADYGRQSAYPLTLAPGKYKLTYQMAAWKGTPQCRAQILSTSGTVLAQTTYVTATPNANGSTSADLSAASKGALEFTVTKSGNYVINFQNSNTAMMEFLLLACQLNKVIIVGDVNGDGNVDKQDIDAIISVICGDDTYKAKADVTGNGTIDVRDVNTVISIICK